MVKLSLITQAIDDQVYSHEVEVDEDGSLSCLIIRPHTVILSWLVLGDINHGGYHWAQVFFNKNSRNLFFGREVRFGSGMIDRRIFKKEEKTY